MTATIYISRSARDQIHAAHQAAGRHVIRAATGRCRACGEDWPCRPHLDAAATLHRYGHLPTRTPGATLDPADPATPYDWFGDGTTETPVPLRHRG